MANATKPWKPSHSDVVNRLRDNLGKLGMKVVDYLTEVRMRLGQDVEGQIDLVTIGGYRIRGGKRGNILTVFEAKAEPSRLFRVVFDALQQLSMYSLALNSPHLYVVGEDKIDKLSNSLGYQRYLVIQEALWDERTGVSEADLEKLSEILVLWNVGIITYDSKWKFRIDKDFGNPEEESTDYLAKTAKRRK